MNNKNYKSMIDNLPMAVLYCKKESSKNGDLLEYEIIEFNQKFEKIINMSNQEFKGKKISDLKKSLNQNGVKCFDLNIELVRKNPNIKYYHILDKNYKLDIITNEDDYATIYFMDMTDEIKEKNKVTQLLDSSSTQIWYVEDPITYGLVNQAHADFAGFKKEDLQHKTIYDFLSKEDADRAYKVNKKLFQIKEQTFIHEWVLNGNNEHRLLEIEQNPIFDKEGNIDYIICSAEDITGKKMAEYQDDMKSRILHSIIGFTEELLVNENPNDALSNGLSMIGEATKVDRVYYWENSFNKDLKQWVTSQKLEWCLGGVTEQINNPELQNIPLEEVGDFIGILAQDKPFIAHVKDLDGEKNNTKEILQSQDIISILVLPVIMDGDFKGFIGFDSCIMEKEWSKVEVSLLNSFVLLYKKSLERQFLESHIIQIKDNFSNFFNTVNDFLCVIDYEGKILSVNQTILDGLGYSEKEIVGHTIYKLYPDNKKDKLEQIIYSSIHGFEKYHSTSAIDKYGELIPIEASFSKGVWDGEPAIFNISKDISQLKLSEEKFSKAFNNTGINMLITEYESGKIIDINNTFLNTLGYSKDEIIENQVMDIDLATDSMDTEELQKMILEEGRISDLDFKLKCKDGSIKEGLTHISTMKTDNKIYLISSFVDMTERNKIMKELERAKEMSDSANQAKGKFLSHISHEIRTPMNAVIGYSDLLSHSHLTEKQKNHINGIKTSSKMLMNIINDVLDWSKIDNNKFELNYTSFSLDEYLNNILKQIDFKHSSRDLKFSIEKDSNIPNILYGDPLRLQQVLLNLISNSMKFTFEGEVIVKVKKLEEYNRQIKLKFKVIDTGVGIPEEKLEYIFDPFHQVEMDSAIQSGGTGLGLPISRQIVSLMNGEIQAKSKVGEGSTFYFTAYFDTKACQDDCNIKELNYFNKSLEQDLSSSLSGLSVLIVDDNEINLDVLNEILISQDMIVTKASNGFQAIEYVHKNDFDIILMDIRMPDLDGYQTSDIIRETHNSKDLPIIAITASASPEERKNCAIRDINDCLTKPIEKEKLFERILDFTKNKHENFTSFKDMPLLQIEDNLKSLLNSDLNEKLKGIYGIDVQSTLNYFDGNEEFLINTLKKFKSNHYDVVHNIRQAMTNQDIELAQRLAHSIKGVSGQILAGYVHELSSNVESELNKGNLHIEDLLIQLDSELRKVFNSLKFAKESKEENFEITQSLNIPVIEDLISKTKESLIESNLDAKNLIGEIENISRNTIIYEDTLKMKEFGDQYDFENALAMLEKIVIKVEKEK